MPVGKYKTFGECVSAQKRKGHKGESPNKICGFIEKKTKEAAAKKSKK